MRFSYLFCLAIWSSLSTPFMYSRRTGELYLGAVPLSSEIGKWVFCGSLSGLDSRQVVDDALIPPSCRQHAEISTLMLLRGVSAFVFIMSAGFGHIVRHRSSHSPGISPEWVTRRSYPCKLCSQSYEWALWGQWHIHTADRGWARTVAKNTHSVWRTNNFTSLTINETNQINKKI